MNAPIMHKIVPAGDNPIGDLRDQVALEIFKKLVDTGSVAACVNNNEPVVLLAKDVAKVSFEFAEAFMRERYERDSVMRAMAQPILHNGQPYSGKTTVRPGDNPPDMDLINA